MNDLSDTDVQSVALNCANCGEPVEIARSALGLFESADKVLCVECLVKVDEYAPRDNLSLEARVALIDDVVEDFSRRLRSMLVRSIRPDLNWSGEFDTGTWSQAGDSTVAAHAPGIWYAGKGLAMERRRNS